MAKAKENIKDLVDIQASVSEKETPKKTPFVGKVMKLVKIIFVVAFMLGVFFIVAKSPEIKEYYKEILTGEEKREIERINTKLNDARQQIEALSVENGQLLSLNTNVKFVEERVAKLESENTDMSKNKADVSLVLGAINRLDNIDTRVSEVAKVSDRGALIAMATMLIKEASERGSDFTYEMTILETLAKDEPRIKSYIEVLGKYSSDGVYSEAFLSSEFEKIYKLSLSEEEESVVDSNDWLARFNKRFGKIITVRYKKTAEAEEVTELNLDRAMYLIKSGEFGKAVSELNLERYAGIVKDTQQLNDWLHYANGRIEFLNALSKVSAYSLGVMKVNELKR